MGKLKEVTLWKLIGPSYRYGTKSMFYIVGFLKRKFMGFLIYMVVCTKFCNIYALVLSHFGLGEVNNLGWILFQ